jgi:hypothetical protein
MYLRMVNTKPAEAEAGIKALINADANFLNTGAGITNFKDKPNGSNPFYETNVRQNNTPSNLRGSRTLSSYLKANSDPRIVAYYGSADPKVMDQGDFQNTSEEVLTAVTAEQSATDPAWFITKAESLFMQAEADERYFGGARAAQLYANGVTASFEERGYTAAQAATLLNGNYKYPTGAFETKLEAIIVQKWISLFGSHAVEAFFEKNRTGYPRTSDVYSSEPGYVTRQVCICTK